MNWWIKLGCKLTGWNANLLSQCSEASRSQLSKYTSAMLILVLIWGVTGFCFAQRYIGLPTWACGFVSLFFITIVVMIERQILLSAEKRISMLIFRGTIALIMAVIGSTIVDQTMFSKDIDKQMANTIEIQVADLAKQRAHIIDEKIATLHHEIDSMDVVNAALQADINNNPLTTIKSVQKIPSTNTDAKGNIKTTIKTVVNTEEVENPKQAILASNSKNVQGLRNEQQKWTEKKQNLEEEVRKECKANVGFLEELEAMYSIVTTRKLAGAFYLIFFGLLMSLELFVVSSKFGDKQCDYEATVIGSQSVRMKQLNAAFGNANV